MQYTVSHVWNCGTVKTTVHYLLHCPNFSNERQTLFNKHQSIDENILNKDDSFNDVKNPILTASIEYLISTKRFDASLYQN